VAIDPATGRFVVPGPDVLELDPLWAAHRLPQAPLPVIRLEDGSLMMDLRGIFLTHAVATLGWDGRPTLGCFDTAVRHEDIAPWHTLLARPARAKGRE
jgi:hypothetical protein